VLALCVERDTISIFKAYSRCLQIK